MELYHYTAGAIPLIISIPHAGTYVPDELYEKFTPDAKKLPDTDWHVAELYQFAKELGAHLLVATHSRYVIDLNRYPNDQSLYPEKFTTTLCPTLLFDATPVYVNHVIQTNEMNDRIEKYWHPYHKKLQAIIKKHENQKMILLDAHSIRSRVPTLFEGKLPDLNIGTADGISASPHLIEKLIHCCEQNTYSYIYNGRFKGGYITRHYGNPNAHVHAIQLELAQHNYMNEKYPFEMIPTDAQKLQHVLQKLLTVAIEWIKN